ncbi:MAG: HipA N-terminal domain-containing protein [Bacteroidetes bacterium]|nr:HipA N-terminal domain-containing protein [Bacteroidota bacterium]MBU1681089.1 HipA N-terminal domain-containing protein [Bacteroidota bacterium]
MRRALVFNHGIPAGNLIEIQQNSKYLFEYFTEYNGDSISLTMPKAELKFEYDLFPPFFEGLLPEGFMLDGILSSAKIDKNDLFSLLVFVGSDLVGSVTVEEIE